MKLKAFFAALLFTIGYFFFTKYLIKSNSDLAAHQGMWSDNITKAQSFLYDFNLPKYNCVLGSSLSTRLDINILPRNYYTLSLSGQGVIDGLIVLSYKSQLPDTLFVEMNFISRNSNVSFVKSVASDALSISVRDKLPLFREKFLPLGILATYAKEKYEVYFDFYKRYTCRIFAKLGLSFTPKIEVVPNSKVDSSNDKLFQEFLIKKKIDMSHLLPTADENLRKVTEILRQLEQKGVRLVFYEMPVDCSLETTLVPTYNREAISTNFSSEKYSYLQNADCSLYKTNDGTHLASESATAYTLFFLDQIKKVRKLPENL